MILSILFVLINHASASENWLCTTESSLVKGTSIYACGIGSAKAEDVARARALRNAQTEFDRICNSSDSCAGFEKTVEPKRTTCEEVKGKWKCYRLVVFRIGTEKSELAQEQTTTAPPLAANQAPQIPTADYSVDDFWRDWNNKYLRH